MSQSRTGDDQEGATPVGRPKLLILRTPAVQASGIREAIDDHFEIIETSPEEALRTLEREGCGIVVSGAGDFVPLERELLGDRSEMLLNSIGEGVCLFDRQGLVVWQNERFKQFRAQVGRRLTAAVMEALKHFEDALARRGAEGASGDAKPLKPRRGYLVLSRTDKYFECLISPVMSGDGAGAERVVRVAAVVRDVTNRERTQRKIDALNEAGRELLHMDAETIRSTNAADRLDSLKERVARFAQELLSFDHFAVRIVNEKTGELQLVMASGMPPEATEIRLHSSREGNGISGYVASTGKSYLCANTSTDSRYVYGIEHAGSSLTVPLKVFGKVIGILNVESEEVGAFNDQDRQFAEIFASSVAMSYHLLTLLLAERVSTREHATGTMEGELSAPLNDLEREAERLREESSQSPEVQAHIERILADVSSIRKRVKDVAAGPQTLLGADDAMLKSLDPAIEGKRVLVIDNERKIADTIRSILTTRGAKVEVRTDGEGALALIESVASPTQGKGAGHAMAFDLVLSDINLGDLTGYDIFAAIRKNIGVVPVILMTGFGYDPHHSIVRASQEGLECVLFKPFQAEMLVDECKKALTPKA